ncbi:MAG: replicative DNA helicase [Planctomycetaceae bacterium]|jgi:replicative DNA helicase|nr:replicative DNA helicase [Planctomycetaceae bacterium]
MIRSAEPAMLSPRPQNLEAEQAVLGSMCLSPEAVDDVAEALRGEHFYFEPNQVIFEAVIAMTKRGVKPDVVTLSEELERAGKLEAVGGDDYLIQILEAVPNAAHARYYADIVIDRWTRRRISEISAVAHAAVVDGTDDTDDILAQTSDNFTRLLESTVRSGPVDMSVGLEMLNEDWKSGNSKGLSTGFVSIDSAIGGLKPATLNVLSAGTGGGKTSLALCIGRNVALHGNRVLIFSLEMDSVEITQRLLALESGLNFTELDAPNELDELSEERMIEASNSLANLPIRIDDAPRISLQRIAAVARLQQRKHGLRLLIIDYLQLVEPSDKRVIREQQIAEISHALKALARELGIPILLVAQLNRNAKSREDKRPVLSDLRESGAIEQDADRVLFLHHDVNADPSEAKLIVAKNRRGPLGEVPLNWVGCRMEYRDAIPD